MKKWIRFTGIITLCLWISNASAGTQEGSVVVGNGLQSVASGQIIQMMVGLMVVLVIIMGAAWLLRRMRGMTGARNASLKVISGLSIGAKERLVLIEVGKEQVLLGVSPGRVQTLHVLEEPVTLEDSAENTNNPFLAKLQEAMQTRR